MASEHNIELPKEFSGAAQLILYTRYGDPREAGWENKWITTWHAGLHYPWFPKQDVQIHKHFWPMLDNAFKELELLGLHKEIHTFDGCYKQEIDAGNELVMPLYAWGAAICLNANENPLGCTGNWSEQFLQAMARHGVYCGQEWSGRKDPKHFAMLNG